MARVGEVKINLTGDAGQLVIALREQNELLREQNRLAQQAAPSLREVWQAMADLISDRIRR